MQQDTFRHQGMRNRLVELLREKEIKSEAVLNAIGKVPRHLFLDPAFESHAYQNKAFPIGAAQTISHPFTVAFQSEMLACGQGSKVLEIGTGCGYQTAVLCEMGIDVFSIERQHTLYKYAKKQLATLNYAPRQLFFGDGYKGLEEEAPFDGIIVTAGAPFVPKPLLSQLKVGGRLVIPVGDETQVMHVYLREDQKTFKKQTFGEFRFVPLLGDRN